MSIHTALTATERKAAVAKLVAAVLWHQSFVRTDGPDSQCAQNELDYAYELASLLNDDQPAPAAPVLS